MEATIREITLMASMEFNELLTSIRNCKTYDSLKNCLESITRSKAATDDTLVMRALRDAEVYALVWGLAAAARDYAGAFFAFYLPGGSSDRSELIEKQSASSAVLQTAMAAVRDDVEASAGNDLRDAVADANAADEAYAVAKLWILSLAGSETIPALPQVILKLQEFAQPVADAASSYANERVTHARLVDSLKSLLNTYLLVWRKTTTGLENPLAEQGILESIDEESGTFVLSSTVYSGQRNTVSISDVSSIDTSRTGPGAQRSVEAPEWRNVDVGKWIRTDDLRWY